MNELIVSHVSYTFFQDGNCPISKEEVIKELIRKYEILKEDAEKLYLECRIYSERNYSPQKPSVIHRIKRFMESKSVSQE